MADTFKKIELKEVAGGYLAIVYYNEDGKNEVTTVHTMIQLDWKPVDIIAALRTQVARGKNRRAKLQALQDQLNTLLGTL